MKPFLEWLPVPPDMSWSMLNRRLDDGIPFQWHHHPELELTLTLNSRGQRFIGDHVERYDDGDLVLVGPNLPHSWNSSETIQPGRPHVALVMWFTPDWARSVSATFVELQAIGPLLERASAGLRFSPEASALARPRIERLFDDPPEARLFGLLQVLNGLARDAAAKPLASRAFVPDPGMVDRGRIDRVLHHIHFNYASSPSLPELAEIAALSPSGLHRLFRRYTQMSLSDYVLRLRIGEACAMLSSTTKPIAHIADAIGYRSLANFNRQFKALKGLTPRAYRKTFQRPAAG